MINSLGCSSCDAYDAYPLTDEDLNDLISQIEGDSPSKPPTLSNYRLFSHRERTSVMDRGGYFFKI